MDKIKIIDTEFIIRNCGVADNSVSDDIINSKGLPLIAEQIMEDMKNNPVNRKMLIDPDEIPKTDYMKKSFIMGYVKGTIDYLKENKYSFKKTNIDLYFTSIYDNLVNEFLESDYKHKHEKYSYKNRDVFVCNGAVLNIKKCCKIKIETAEDDFIINYEINIDNELINGIISLSSERPEIFDQFLYALNVMIVYNFEKALFIERLMSEELTEEEKAIIEYNRYVVRQIPPNDVKFNIFGNGFVYNLSNENKKSIAMYIQDSYELDTMLAIKMNIPKCHLVRCLYVLTEAREQFIAICNKE